MRSSTSGDYHAGAVSRAPSAAPILLALLAFGGGASLLLLSCGAGEAGPGDLNVMVVTLDTTRVDALGAYGQPLPVTPKQPGCKARVRPTPLRPRVLPRPM